MKPTSIAALGLVTLLGVGITYWLGAHEGRRHWPTPTPPPPPSPIYTPSNERVPTAAEIALQAQGHNQMLELVIERALVANVPQQRETAFTFLLPELIQVEPTRVVALVARQTPGEARDVLRTEVARQWIAQDPHAAVVWMKSLSNDERRASASAAVDAIAAHSPDEAMDLADEFGLGKRTTTARN